MNLVTRRDPLKFHSSRLWEKTQDLWVDFMLVMAVMMSGMPIEGLAGGKVGGGGAATAVKEEKSAFDLKLESFDSVAKITKIVVRSFTDLGLKEAKYLVEKAPVVIKQGGSEEISCWKLLVHLIYQELAATKQIGLPIVGDVAQNTEIIGLHNNMGCTHICSKLLETVGEMLQLLQQSCNIHSTNSSDLQCFSVSRVFD